ncbi:MAG: helix-turn-helix domain-containing protein [Pseudomonadota bacterium]
MMHASKAKKTDLTQAARSKFLWMRQVFSDPTIGHLACRVAGLLIDHINATTREAWPSQSRLAQAAGVTPRSIQNALQKLTSSGHLTVRRMPGVTNRYRLVHKPMNAHSLDGLAHANSCSRTDESRFVRLPETPLKRSLDEAERQRIGLKMASLAKQLGARSKDGANA